MKTTHASIPLEFGGFFLANCDFALLEHSLYQIIAHLNKVNFTYRNYEDNFNVDGVKLSILMNIDSNRLLFSQDDNMRITHRMLLLFLR